MAEWSDVRLGDLVDNFDSKRLPVKSSERRAGPYPYYGASGVVDWVDGYLLDGEYLLVSEDGENLRSRATPIAFTVSGKFWPNNHAHVLRGKEPVDTSFLKYALALADITGYLTGSAQPKLSRGSMDAIRLRVPDLPVRHSIADVLCALDDKIAANTRLATTADDLARSLLASDEPNVPVSEIATHSRLTVNPETMTEPQVVHFSLPAFDTGVGPESVGPESIKSNKFLVSEPAVLVSKLNPRFPRVWNLPRLPVEPALASTEFVVLVPTACSTTVLWALTSQPRFGAALEGMVAGTSGSHQRVKPAEMLATLVPDPRRLAPSLLAQVDALGARSRAAQAENVTLAATRDTLLPQLMSGKLRVRDAERIAVDAGL